MSKFLTASLIFTAAYLSAQQMAAAQVLVMGKGDAQICYDRTKMGNEGSVDAIRSCTAALKQPLSGKDQAATFINRGILLMRKGDYADARTDYERAIALRPNIDEAYINYGAVLLYLRDYAGALDALNTSIEMGTEKMPEALYNRALIYHAQQDYRAAYDDLTEALTLRPDWEIAQTALSRYNVQRKSGHSSGQ